MARYASVNVPISAATAVLVGGIMLASPPRSFGALAYQRGPFLLMPQVAWGAVWVTAGALALAVNHITAITALLAVVACWAILLLYAQITVGGVSPLAGLAWGWGAAMLLRSVAVRGTTARR